MAKKTFTYRGKTLEELSKMSLKELAEILPSRQRRKIIRGFSDSEKKLVEKLKKKDVVKTQLRDMIVLPSMIGKTIKIYSGKEYTPIIIQEETLGCYLGELVLSRRRVMHSNPGVGSSSKPAVK
ncbi:MAG: 30S ribosomal protein S19 [Candidatus Nanoarchaeia archaeon]